MILDMVSFILTTGAADLLLLRADGRTEWFGGLNWSSVSQRSRQLKRKWDILRNNKPILLIRALSLVVTKQ